MPYSVSLLTSAAECDALTESLNADKEALAFRKLSMDRQRKSFTATAVTVAAELQATEAEIAALQAIMATLPEGRLKEDTASRLTRAEYQRFILLARQKGFGNIAAIDREIEMTRADVQIAEIDTALAEVAARKAGF